MIVKHKYDLGQMVYLIYDNKVCSFRIQQLGYSITEKRAERLWYYLEQIGGNRDEDYLFASKEELLKSL